MNYTFLTAKLERREVDNEFRNLQDQFRIFYTFLLFIVLPLLLSCT